MFLKANSVGKQIVFCNSNINDGKPIFLDIGDEEPVSLFGGFSYAAAISDKGEIIFINRIAVRKSPKSHIEAVPLPDGEKASSVAFLDDLIVVMSTKDHIFSSSIELRSNVVRFSPVSELMGFKIVWLSGS